MKNYKGNKIGIVSDDSQYLTRIKSLRLFLDDLKDIPVLTKEQSLSLIEMAQNGDLEARNKLVESNLRFCVSIGLKYRYKSLEYGDLISACYEGLFKAIDKFNVESGFNFITYAVWWCIAELKNFIKNNSSTIRIPINKQDYTDIDFDLIDQYGYTFESFKSEMDNISIYMIGNVKSLNDYVFNKIELYETIPDESFDIEIDNDESYNKIMKVINNSTLSNMERVAILYKIGISTYIDLNDSLFYIDSDAGKSSFLEDLNNHLSSNYNWHSISSLISSARRKLKKIDNIKDMLL